MSAQKVKERVDYRIPHAGPHVPKGAVTPVLEVEEIVEVNQAFTLTPLPEEKAPDGAVILKAGTLREIRVDRDALENNTDVKEFGGKLKPTWVVREKGSKKKLKFFALEIRGSTMCLNGTEMEAYGCGGSVSSETAYLATVAEIVAYTKPPDRKKTS